MAKVISITTTRAINGRSINAEPESGLVLVALGDGCTVDPFAVRVSIPAYRNGCRAGHSVATDGGSKEGKAGKSGLGAKN